MSEANEHRDTKTEKTLEAEVNAAVASGVPFSLCCVDCDGGMDIKSALQAKSEGWIEIQYDDGASYNFSGICPPCQEPEGAVRST